MPPPERTPRVIAVHTFDPSEHMKRVQAFGATWLLAGMVALASGCGGDGPEAGAGEPSAGEVERGGTAIVAELSDISMPSPLLAGGEMDINLAFDVLNMELLRGRWENGRVVYQTADQSSTALARSYEYVGADSAALRFHMRSDAKWSDGQPITAHDFVFTYELVDDPALASPRQDYVEQMDSVVAENDSTLVFYFARRYPEMVAHTGIAPMPRHVYQGVKPEELRTHPTILNPANGNLVVSGPWMIGEWAKGQRVELVPNPHFQPRPNLDRLVFRIIPETTTRQVELQTGSVDMMRGLPFDQIPTLQAQAPDVRLEREQKRFYEFIAYNPKAHPAFADPEIRRALGLAINVPAVLQSLQMEEYAVPAGGPYPPIFEDLYDPRLTPPLDHAPDRARQILEAKGWRDTDGDGIREKDGRPLRFTLVTNAENRRRIDVTQIVQQQMRQIGVDVQLRTLEFNTFMNNLIKREYEAALGGWGVSMSPDLTGLWGPESPMNITGYSNPEVNALFQRALAQPTREAAAPFWKQAATQMAQDQPYTWLYFLDHVDPVQDRLRGTRIDTYGPYQNTWEWWIPRSQQRGGQPATP